MTRPWWGDKTLAFRLMDEEMYWKMAVDQQSLVIDRGWPCTR